MKNVCSRCGVSVGHRGTDTECVPCQYVIKLEKENEALRKIKEAAIHLDNQNILKGSNLEHVNFRLLREAIAEHDKLRDE